MFVLTRYTHDGRASRLERTVTLTNGLGHHKHEVGLGTEVAAGLSR